MLGTFCPIIGKVLVSNRPIYGNLPNIGQNTNILTNWLLTILETQAGCRYRGNAKFSVDMRGERQFSNENIWKSLFPRVNGARSYRLERVGYTTDSRLHGFLCKNRNSDTDFLSRLNLVQKETMPWYVVVCMYVVCGILQNWSLYPHTLMYSHGTWTQWSLGRVTYVTSTDMGLKVI